MGQRKLEAVPSVQAWADKITGGGHLSAFGERCPSSPQGARHRLRNLRWSEDNEVPDAENKFMLFVCQGFKSTNTLLGILSMCTYTFKLFLSGTEEYVPSS